MSENLEHDSQKYSNKRQRPCLRDSTDTQTGKSHSLNTASEGLPGLSLKDSDFTASIPWQRLLLAFGKDWVPMKSSALGSPCM